MKRVIFSTIVLLFIVISQALCQVDSTSLKSIYEKEVIYFSGNKYIKNEVKHSIRKINNEFKINTEGYQQFQLYKSDLRKAKLYLLPGFLFYVSGLLVLNNNYDAGIGLLVGSIASSTISIHFGLRADKKLKKAVWIRNGEILLH